MRVQVKLCYQNWWNYYHRIYTIAVTEYKSGSENVKNGLYDSILNSYFDLTKSINYCCEIYICGACPGGGGNYSPYKHHPPALPQVV